MEKVKLEGDAKELLESVSSRMADIQAEIDEQMLEYEKKANELEAIKAKIRPLRAILSPYGEMQAGIASRKSRTKYFPEFATRNFDDSKDEEFFNMVRSKLS